MGLPPCRTILPGGKTVLPAVQNGLAAANQFRPAAK
jgi:hypothetical protein